MAKDTTPIVEKKYYVLVDYIGDDWKKKDAWKEGEVITLQQSKAIPYIRARILLPFKTAILTGVYKSDQEEAVYVKPKPTIRSSAPIDDSEEKPKKKTLVKNSLRDAVQEKKENQEPKPEPENEPENEEPLAEEPKPVDTSSSAAEDAIKKKIAVAKAKKK